MGHPLQDRCAASRDADVPVAGCLVGPFKRGLDAVFWVGSARVGDID